MNNYRVVVRFGKGREYRVIDIAAESLRAALQQLVAEYPEGVGDADLVEVRRQVDPEERSYTPE